MLFRSTGTAVGEFGPSSSAALTARWRWVRFRWAGPHHGKSLPACHGRRWL